MSRLPGVGHNRNRQNKPVNTRRRTLTWRLYAVKSLDFSFFVESIHLQKVKCKGYGIYFNGCSPFTKPFTNSSLMRRVLRSRHTLNRCTFEDTTSTTYCTGGSSTAVLAETGNVQRATISYRNMTTKSNRFQALYFHSVMRYNLHSQIDVSSKRQGELLLERSNGGTDFQMRRAAKFSSIYLAFCQRK